ncbi:Dihydroorotase [Candidatus Filomicrobium marinum]|uniref:Dihydroorotase n=3 Tax=Hyphomicrobiaceae TaxID=45401 RepID=A0A0D6JB58_9HYPH|nr:dihydroorotase [Filomicrobium sp.]CFX01370.1 Dihydroorotase [Candidatus Filomicrobium marinum]CPR15433.1 Dihydroorotase [Candidatus Filomicrobium marinum]SDO65261.1 dihydroorotase [Filomicrobium insigne]
MSLIAMNTKTEQSKTSTGKRQVFINARIIDPASGRDEPGGLLVEGTTIADLGPHLRRNAPEGATVIDCQGNILCPGLIDCQVFTGEPGAEHRETLKTASLAAAAGGVTTIVVMPDTSPVIDQVALVDFIQRRARDNAKVHVHTMAAMTRGLAGTEMTEIGLLKRAGAIAFTNGKSTIANTAVMRNVLNYSKDFGALIVHHCEDPHLSNDGAMNSGEVAARLGLPGVSSVAETIVIDRDVRLVELTGGRYHAATISCEASLNVIRAAKTRNLPVTCGVSINHLTLNENDIGPYRTFFKVRPPLRREEDRVAMVRGINNGDIDIIVSSHDPQDADVKRRPFAEAADGAVGLETMLPAALRLYHSGDLSLLTLLRAMTINPAKLLGIGAGRLQKGAVADLIVFDPSEPWVVNKDVLRSRSKNSPFDEARLQGRVLRTMVAGETVYQVP